MQVQDAESHEWISAPDFVRARFFLQTEQTSGQAAAVKFLCVAPHVQRHDGVPEPPW